MTKKLRIVLAQLNLTVGDIQGNLQSLIHSAITARDTLTADVIVFPELAITGYPPEDLLLRKSFIADANKALYEFMAAVQNIYCVVGHPHQTSQGLFNSASVIFNGTILGRAAKQNLPNYDVFDEYRYFIPGTSPCVVPIHGIPVGVVICKDLWGHAPAQQAANLGARLILALNGSPFEIRKQDVRMQILSKTAKSATVPIAYTNYVGGQDELIFDGGSMIVDAEGTLCQHAGFFNEILFPVDIELTSTKTTIAKIPTEFPSDEKNIYDALVLAVRDYVEKNNFPGVLVGLSGGIDSALVLAIAVDALGHERVKAILMPSRHTADMSNEDALALAKNLNVNHDILSIEPVYQQFLETLAPSFADKKIDLTEQNIQARCRAVILMALANKFGKIVLTTSNRSEIAVGYTTLYGDMAGGFAVLKDVLKTQVYALARYRNQLSAVIPQRILDRAPTAELAPEQKDEDSLPPYAVLDKILEFYLDHDCSSDEIIAQGFEADTVKKVVRLIYASEYKRRQLPAGSRIHTKAFEKGWRYPTTSKYLD